MAVDTRFYLRQATLTTQSIASEIGSMPGDLPDREITGLSSFAHARESHLCFVEDFKHIKTTDRAVQPGLCLVPAPPEAGMFAAGSFLVTQRPKEAFFAAAQKMFKPRTFASEGISDASNLHAETDIAPGVFIGEGAAIGRGSRIGPNSVIGPGVQIGAACEIGANVSIQFSLIGNGVRIQSGARLGEAGFGLMPLQDQPMQDIPHFGRVIIQDHVTIGANTSIDRGMLDDTIIGEGSKMDNQCHIGHNTIIGRNTVMAAYAGISGSVVIGDNVRMGGRVGLVDHIRVGHGAQIAAGSAVMTSVPDKEVWAGAPAKPIRKWQRELIWLKNQARKDKSK